MRLHASFASYFAVLILNVLCASAGALAQNSSTGKLPADPWPRVVDLANGQVLVYQPQINKWVDNQLEFRAALAISTRLKDILRG